MSDLRLPRTIYEVVYRAERAPKLVIVNLLALDALDAIALSTEKCTAELDIKEKTQLGPLHLESVNPSVMLGVEVVDDTPPEED